MIEKVQVMLTAKLASCFLILFVNFGITNADCQFNRTNLVCTYKTSEDPLKEITPPKTLDTIIVHNAKIDLTDDLFSIDKTLEGVSFLDLSGNKIQRIGRRGFDKTHNVEFLYLSNNSIKQSQPDPFMSLGRLRRLEMNNALGGDFEENEALLRNLFHSNNDFTNLAEIQLNSNKIKSLHPKTFCGVTGLTRLELSQNNLENLDFVKKCFKDLKGLFMAGNNISTIPQDIWDFMPSLSSFDISNNPIHCNCTIVELLKADDVSFINQGNTFCASPPNLKGKNVFELPNDLCKSKSSKGYSFFNFLILALIAGAVLYIYRNYRQRMSSYYSKTVVGYQNIEPNVQPEFV